MRIFRQLYMQVLVAIACAILLGLAAPGVAVAMKPLGDGFIALLKILLAPIIFCTIVLGMTHIRNMGQFGRLALKALLYFEVMSTIAMVLGFVTVNIVQPGAGLHATNLAANASMAQIATTASPITAAGYLLSIIPSTLVDAFAKGEIVQVLFISVLTGAALSVGSAGEESTILKMVAEGQGVLFRILGFIMRLAPIGAFGALAAAVGTFGAATLLTFAKLVILYWATSAVFVIVILGAMSGAVGLSIFKLLQLIREELLLVLGTASSEVALPRLLLKLEQAGCDKAVVGFVLPAGYSFNLDGTGIYMAMSVAFIAQATDTPFDLLQQGGVLAILLLTSKGGGNVPGAAFIKVAATLQSVRVLPLNGVGLLLGIDRLMSICTAMTNMVGNAVAVFVVAKWEGAFDQAKFDEYMSEQAIGTILPSGAEALPAAERG